MAVPPTIDFSRKPTLEGGMVTSSVRCPGGKTCLVWTLVTADRGAAAYGPGSGLIDAVAIPVIATTNSMT
jgi:hypothetical protein